MISLNSLMKFGLNTCKLTFDDISCDVYGYINKQGRDNIDTHE